LFKSDLVSADLADYDAVMVGGGTLVYRSGCVAQVTEAVERSVPIFVFGSGVGDPLFGEVLQSDVWNAALERSLFVGVRGIRSKQVLEEAGCRATVEVIGDPALLAGEAIMSPPVLEERHMVINLCDPNHSRLWGWNNEAVQAAVVDAAKLLLDAGWSLTFVSFESRNNRYVQGAVEALGQVGTERVRVFNGYESLDRTLALFASAQMVIGEKLHATVLAAAVGTPFIALEYRPKCRDFAATMGFDPFVIRTDQLTASTLLEAVEEMNRHDAELRRHLRATVAEYRQRLRDAATCVQEQLRGHRVSKPSELVP
jgi:polysaccharide pyruvyl transferase WcaK-like protein